MDLFKESFWLQVATPIYIIVIAVEIFVSSLHLRKVYSLRGVLENIYLSVVNMGLDIVLRGFALFLLDATYQVAIFHWDGGMAYWIALLIAEDFVYYWLHRVDHQCRLFWAVHVTHHSSEEFNLSVGFRSSVFQPLYRFVYFIPLAFLGFKGMDIFLMYSLTQLYGLLVHTQLINKLGFLEWFMVTPSHHRVHHASNILYLDRNLGMVFIIWDKLFGTFTPETEPVKYGITKALKRKNATSLIFHEWRDLLNDIRSTPSWKDKLKYVLCSPGWSPGGNAKTSGQLRQTLPKHPL